MVVDVGTVGYISSCIIAGVLGGFGVAIVHATFEHAWFYFLDYLDKRGSIERLAPSIPVTMTNYRKESFWAVAIGPMPMLAVAFAGRHGYMSRCHLSGHALSSFLFTWTVMALHDAYFLAVHSLMHKFKSVYRRTHQQHHAKNGDITVFSTAFGRHRAHIVSVLFISIGIPLSSADVEPVEFSVSRLGRAWSRLDGPLWVQTSRMGLCSGFAGSPSYASRTAPETSLFSSLGSKVQ